MSDVAAPVDGRTEGQALLERIMADNARLTEVANHLDEVKASIGIATEVARRGPGTTETTVRAFFVALRKLIEDRERTICDSRDKVADVDDV